MRSVWTKRAEADALRYARELKAYEEAQADDALNTEYLKKLEQDRISQAASASRLFRDRAQMIEGCVCLC